MKMAISVATALLVATLAWSGTALAEHKTMAPLPGAGDSQDRGVSNSEDRENPSAAIPDEPITRDPMMRDVVGEVVQVDPDKGMLVLNTERGLVAFHAPASALTGVNVGDLVRVRATRAADETGPTDRMPGMPPLPEGGPATSPEPTSGTR